MENNGSLWLWTNLFLNRLEYMEMLKVERLKFMEMRPQTLGLLENMLKNSRFKNRSRGVPQGSQRGPEAYLKVQK